MHNHYSQIKALLMNAQLATIWTIMNVQLVMTGYLLFLSWMLLEETMKSCIHCFILLRKVVIDYLSNYFTYFSRVNFKSMKFLIIFLSFTIQLIHDPTKYDAVNAFYFILENWPDKLQEGWEDVQGFVPDIFHLLLFYF